MNMEVVRVFVAHCNVLITIPTGQTATAGSLYNAGTLQNYGTLNLGSLSGNTTAGTLQTLDYKYHIRGGLLGINLDANNNLTNSLFSYKLAYEDDGTYYDGNIRNQYWKSNLDSKERSFTYTYDGASRIKSAVYTSPVVGENYALNSVNYDRNGNITTLSRNGLKSNNTFGLIDNLAYTYHANSNKILKVDDISNETASFKDITGNDYTYWEDGSLKSDNNKEITQIEYNFLKLPKKISLTNNRWISYEYDASGLKLKKTLSTGKVTEYEEDEIYEDTLLYQTIHDEGRIVNGIYEYNIKDHLGNLRVAFKDSLGVAKITQANHTGVWGEDLPTLSYQNTPKISKFRYSTYEEENDFGIGLFDAHARLFDNIVPHFLQIDPLAEKYFDLTTYSYVFNNPIRYSDPSGLAPSTDNKGADGLTNGEWLQKSNPINYEVIAEQGKNNLLQDKQKDNIGKYFPFPKGEWDWSAPGGTDDEIFRIYETSNIVHIFYASWKGFKKKWVNHIPIMFENTNLNNSDWGDLKKGAAMTPSTSNIYFSFNFYNQRSPTETRDLLRHEFGHTLQYKRYSSFDKFVIITSSIYSAKYLEHKFFWTERQANTLSYKYFNYPSNWNFKEFPIDNYYLNTINNVPNFD